MQLAYGDEITYITAIDKAAIRDTVDFHISQGRLTRAFHRRYARAIDSIRQVKERCGPVAIPVLLWTPFSLRRRSGEEIRSGDECVG